MRTVAFTYPGTKVVNVWLYEKDGVRPYSRSAELGAAGFLAGFPPVMTTLRADGRGIFSLKLSSFGLPPGDYELHVCEATCRREIDGAARIPFSTFGSLHFLRKIVSRRKAAGASTTEEGKMNDVAFGIPGKEKVRVWLYQRDGKLGYNYARGAFEATDGGQSSPLVRDKLDNQFHFPIAWLGPARLPDGEYRLEADGGAKTYFRVRWATETDPVVTVHGQQFPQDEVKASPIGPENVGGITKATVKDALDAFANASAQAGTGKPKVKAVEPKPAKPKGNGLMLEFEGKTKSVAEWAVEKGLNPLTIYARLADGCTVEQALDTPTKSPHQLATGDRAGRAVELD